MGVFAGDGNFHFDAKTYHYKVSIELSEYQREYTEILADIMERVFAKKPRVWANRKKHSIVVRLYGKSLYALLRQFLRWRGNKTHTISFMPSSLSLGKIFLRGVIRGLVASDGSVDRRNRCITFGVTSKKLAEQFSEIVKVFGITSQLHRSKKKGRRRLCHIVTIGSIEMLEKFKLDIGLTDPARASLLTQITERR